MDSSQLLRIRSEQAPKLINTAKTVDSSLLTYQRMITANSTCIPTNNSQTTIPLDKGTIVESCTTSGTCYFAQKQGSLYLPSSGSGSKVYSNFVALKNAGNAEKCTANPNQFITLSGCCSPSAGYYPEPGRYDPDRPNPDLIKRSPCGYCNGPPRYVSKECCDEPGLVYSLPAGCNNCCKGVVQNY
jgi:hypothetical protein